MHIRRLLGMAAVLVLSASAALAQANFPARRIQVILPYPAGGIVDVATRIVTDRLSEMWSQPIIIEAKPGASGSIAWEQVSNAQPDGYMWTSFTPAVSANPRMQKGVRWSEKNFVPIGAFAWAPSALVVNADMPVNTLAEFIDYARKQPGVLNWGNPGVGTSLHLNTAMFLAETKLDIAQIQYRGQPPALLDLLAGRIQMKIASVGLVADHVATGKLKALAVISKTRSPLMPNVPTMAEAGYPEVNVVAWYGLAAPRGTPQPVIDKINNSIHEVVAQPKVRAALEAQGLQAFDPISSADLVKLVESDTEKYAKIIAEANIRIGE